MVRNMARRDPVHPTATVPGFGLLVAVVSVVTVAFLGALVFASGQFMTVIDDVGETLAALVAAAACWRRARVEAERLRRGWLLLGSSALSWGRPQLFLRRRELVVRD